MRKYYSVLLLIFVMNFGAIAGTGDTVTVQSHNAALWSWYGSQDRWAQFPSDSISWHKILLRYKLGCPSSGCSQWDYTTKIEVLHRTGKMDSTLKQAPSFKVDNQTLDSIWYTLDTVYCYFFDTIAKATDSLPCPPIQIIVYGDTNNPTVPTDTINGWKGGFYNYKYNSSGNVFDSLQAHYDSTWYVNYTSYYNVFEVIEPIELARVMTPYAGNYSNSWNFTWTFDVTDYAPILHDSVEIRAHYGGWSSGFTITLDFDFIEGTPPRDPIAVRNVYHGDYKYGNATYPIDSIMKAVSMTIDSNAVQSMFKVTASGHSFGGNQNCSEFCAKNYYVLTDNVVRDQHKVWRDDCGMNPLFPQAGTWLYDRSAWCPGNRTLSWKHDLTPYLIAGQTHSIKMNWDPYTYTGGASFPPSYIVDAQLFTYKAPNFTNDADIVEIISPNVDAPYNRFNPICGKPVIVVRNTGTDTLKTLQIDYGVQGATPLSYTWTGTLPFLATDTVVLPSLGLTSFPGQQTTFEATLSKPNGKTDEYAYNNKLTSSFNIPPVLMNTFIVFYRTNNKPSENVLTITDVSSGQVMYSISGGAANAFYRDTVWLPDGCYELKLTDSDKDGLSFFANSDGSGSLSLVKYAGGVYKNFPSDFGTQLTYQFNVGSTLSVEETDESNSLMIFPNPASDVIEIRSMYHRPRTIQAVIYGISGEVVGNYNFRSVSNAPYKLNIGHIMPGLYIVEMRDDQGHVQTKKLVIQ